MPPPVPPTRASWATPTSPSPASTTATWPTPSATKPRRLRRDAPERERPGRGGKRNLLRNLAGIDRFSQRVALPARPMAAEPVASPGVCRCLPPRVLAGLAAVLLLGGCRVDATVEARVQGGGGVVTARFALDREAVAVLGGAVAERAQTSDLQKAG